MFLMQISGSYACFTNPVMKVERVSYPVITPSAVRGLLESVLWHPGMKWHVRKIYVLNPIRYTSIRRNEVKSKVSARNVRSVMKGEEKALYISASDDIQQRAAVVLQDVNYIVQAEFTMTAKANATDNPGKFTDMFKRRLRRGACYHQGYLGCREFPAQLSLYEDDEDSIETAAELQGRDENLGFMLYDMNYDNPADIRPVFYEAVLKNGVIDVPEWEVIKNAHQSTASIL